jgi:RHS repeat-associated protein
VNGTYDAQDRQTQYGTATFTYTSDGQRLTRTDASGTTTYGYDALGNLRSVTLPGKQIDYVIDGENRRVGKKVNGALVQGFLYDGPLRPVAELNGAGGVVSRFVYATGDNVPDYMVKGGVAYRLVKDLTGSVRLVVNSVTGAVAQRLDYDEFGRVTQDTSPGFQPFGFAGGLYDADTKLVHFGARDYDAETGRWTAKDPLGFGGGQTNLYAYVNNDPVNFSDPTGLCLTDEERERLEKLKDHLNDLYKGLLDPNNWPVTAKDNGFNGLTPEQRRELADRYGELIDKIERQLDPAYDFAKHLGF